MVIFVSFLLLIMTLGNSQQQLVSRKCPEGQFPCGDTSYCVERRFNCDGTADCPNGADELKCVDMSGYLKTVIGEQKKTSHSRKINQTACELDSFPKVCACIYETVINCKGSSLTTIPDDIDRKVQVLLMRKNNISRLTIEQLKPYPNIHALFLDENGIKEIPVGVFRDVKLMTLSLARNQLTDIKKGTFEGLNDTLKTLFLNNNKLTYFNSSVLYGFEYLKELHLEYNNIKFSESNFGNLNNLRLLLLSHNKISKIDKNILTSLTSLMGLFLDYNEIETIEPKAFDELESLEELNLGYNKIKQLPSNIFHGLANLTSLNIGYNKIKQLPANIFKGLVNLTSLTLAYNDISKLPTTTFKFVSQLESLYMEDIDIDDISIELFKPLKQLNRIHFKKFRYCSYVPLVRVCEPRSDGLSSTQHLLEKPILRVSIWIVATVTCIGNTIVLLGRTILSRNAEETSQVSLLFIKNLSAADLMMGIYLFVVASKDINFRGTYNANAHAWMSSLTCTFCGAIAMASSEVSVFTLSFMSIERHSRIVSPLTSFDFSVKRAYLVLGTIWVIGILVAVAPIMLWGIKDPLYKFYGSNGFCFPMHMADPYKMGWQYSAFVFLGINFIGVLIISYSYISMYCSIQSTRSHAHCKKIEMDLAKRFFFIVITDCLCWIPIIVLKIIALTKTDIPQDLYAWVVVFILPVNSAMNPIIYSISSKAFWKRMKELLKQKISWPNLSGSRTRSYIYRVIWLYRQSETTSEKRPSNVLP